MKKCIIAITIALSLHGSACAVNLQGYQNIMRDLKAASDSLKSSMESIQGANGMYDQSDLYAKASAQSAQAQEYLGMLDRAYKSSNPATRSKCKKLLGINSRYLYTKKAEFNRIDKVLRHNCPDCSRQLAHKGAPSHDTVQVLVAQYEKKIAELNGKASAATHELGSARRKFVTLQKKYNQVDKKHRNEDARIKKRNKKQINSALKSNKKRIAAAKNGQKGKIVSLKDRYSQQIAKLQQRESELLRDSKSKGQEIARLKGEKRRLSAAYPADVLRAIEVGQVELLVNKQQDLEQQLTAMKNKLSQERKSRKHKEKSLQASLKEVQKVSIELAQEQALRQQQEEELRMLLDASESETEVLRQAQDDRAKEAEGCCGSE